MSFLERLAEQRIQEAQARGEFDDLPGAGKPLPQEEDLTGVDPCLRMAYRILKNAGYVPEEIQLRREIAEIRQLLQRALSDESLQARARRRLLLLTERLGHMRAGNLMIEDRYLVQVTGQLDPDKKRPARGRVNKASSAKKEIER